MTDKERPSPSRFGVVDGADNPLVKSKLFCSHGSERAFAQRQAERQMIRRKKKLLVAVFPTEMHVIACPVHNLP